LLQMPVIDHEKCNLCKLCIDICPCGVISIIDNVVTLSCKKDCFDCGKWCVLCEEVCPASAISCPIEIVVEELQK